MKPSSNRRTDILIIVFVTLAIGLLSTLAINSYINREHRWFQVVSPRHEKAVEILAVNRLLRAYVRTEQGNLYLCGGRSWLDACEPVKASQVPVAPLPGRWRTCTGQFPESPRLAGNVTDSLEMGQCFEGRTYARIVILDDGTMWQWQRTYSWVNNFALASGALTSFSLGALIGWAIARVRRYLREPVGGTEPQGRLG